MFSHLLGDPFKSNDPFGKEDPFGNAFGGKSNTTNKTQPDMFADLDILGGSKSKVRNKRALKFIRQISLPQKKMFSGLQVIR